MPLPDLDSSDRDASRSGSTEASAPGSHHGHLGVRLRSTGLIDRIAPCRRSHTSGGMSSQRSMMAAARGSVPRASHFLLVGQGQHPQGQDLVDLGGVVEVARALRRHLRVVVEDDRRGQHDVVRPDQHREGPVVVACRGRFARS